MDLNHSVLDQKFQFQGFFLGNEIKIAYYGRKERSSPSSETHDQCKSSRDQ